MRFNAQIYHESSQSWINPWLGVILQTKKELTTMTSKGMPITAVVLGAGRGTRMNSAQNKLLINIKGIPILYRTLARLQQSEIIDDLILVCHRDDEEPVRALLSRHGQLSKISAIIEGGAERADSVRIGLNWVRSQARKGIVMTHDGARPFITTALIQRLAEAVREQNIAIPVVKVVDTVRKADDSGRTTVLDREQLYATQTPQAFAVEMIQPCFFQVDPHVKLTDEASYFEQIGKNVTLVTGEQWNIKITRPADLKWAESLLQTHDFLQLAGLDK